MTLTLEDRSVIAYADDVSPNPGKGVPKDLPIFDSLAPQSQTKFKHWRTFKRKIKSIKKEGKELKAAATYISMIGGAVGLVDKKIGTIINAYGGMTYIVGDFQCKSFRKMKKKVRKKGKHVVKVDFRWIQSKKMPLIGEFRYKEYCTFKGKRVSKCKKWKQRRYFDNGERR